VYQTRFGPEYRISYATSIGLLVGVVVMIAATWWLISKRVMDIGGEGKEDEVSHAVTDGGALHTQ
jgi:hypothetical protein